MPFTTVQELAARLGRAHAGHSVDEVIPEYIAPEFVTLDELEFTPLVRLLAHAFYRIIASRYERSSLIVTSNKSFESQGEVFPDPVIASACWTDSCTTPNSCRSSATPSA